jgi:hypothetical protein
LPQVDRPSHYSGGTMLLISSVFIALVGIGLTAYLAISAE